MYLFYSGDGFSWAQPEVLLGEEANLMMTYADQCGKEPDPRFRAIYRARKEAFLRKLKEQKAQKGNDDGERTLQDSP